MAKKIIVDTKVDRQVDDERFRTIISKTAELIRYLGDEYIKELEKINNKYIIENKKTITERELVEKTNNSKNNE